MTTANLAVGVQLRPLKGIVKVRRDLTLVGTWLLESNQEGLTIEWRTRSAGFGFLRFWCCDDGQVICDNEDMDEAFVGNVLRKALENSSPEQWPALVRNYGGIDGLLKAAKPSAAVVNGAESRLDSAPDTGQGAKNQR